MRARPRSARYRWCLIAFFAAAGCLLGAVAAFSYVIDPFRLFHSSDYIATPAPNFLVRNVRIELSSYSSITKAMRLAIEKPSHIVLGTSVADHGLALPGS